MSDKGILEFFQSRSEPLEPKNIKSWDDFFMYMEERRHQLASEKEEALLDALGSQAAAVRSGEADPDKIQYPKDFENFKDIFKRLGKDPNYHKPDGRAERFPEVNRLKSVKSWQELFAYFDDILSNAGNFNSQQWAQAARLIRDGKITPADLDDEVSLDHYPDIKEKIRELARKS